MEMHTNMSMRLLLHQTLLMIRKHH